MPADLSPRIVPLVGRSTATPSDGRGGPSVTPVAPPFGGGGLVASNAPPFRLPAEHFAAALAFWLVGAAGLIWIAPDLARGHFLLPRVAAVTHLFTLGWITTSIQGALYQFLPVALLQPIRSERAAHLSFLLYVPGLTLFVGGLATGRQPLMLIGAALFGTGLLIFLGNLAATLHRCGTRNLTWWALTGAAVSLLSTVALGVSLAGNLRWGYLGGDRILALAVHLHVAIAGWVLLVMVGVAHRLLPMFLLSHGASETPARLAVGLIASGVGLLLALHHALNPLIVWSIAGLLAGGIIAFLVQAALHFRHRRKPAIDPGMRLAAAGLAMLGVAVGLAPFFLVRGMGAPAIATGYVASLLAALTLFVAGHYYKIVPFLVWFHRFGPLVGKQPVPRVADLFDPRLAGAAAALLALGMFGLVSAILAGTPPLARLAAASVAAGALITAGQMLGISRRRPA